MYHHRRSCLSTVLCDVNRLLTIITVTSRVRPPNGGRRPLYRRAAPVAGPCTLVGHGRRLKTHLFTRYDSAHVVGCHLANNSIKSPTVHACAFSPNCWGTGGGWGLGWKWAPIGGLQYRTHMQAPKYDVQFLRSEALRSSSSSSSRTRQIKEC